MEARRLVASRAGKRAVRSARKAVLEMTHAKKGLLEPAELERLRSVFDSTWSGQRRVRRHPSAAIPASTSRVKSEHWRLCRQMCGGTAAEVNSARITSDGRCLPWRRAWLRDALSAPHMNRRMDEAEVRLRGRITAAA